MDKNTLAKRLDKSLGVCIKPTISALRYRHATQIKKWCPRITLGMPARSVAYRALWGIHEGNCKPVTAWEFMHA